MINFLRVLLYPQPAGEALTALKRKKEKKAKQTGRGRNIFKHYLMKKEETHLTQKPSFSRGILEPGAGAGRTEARDGAAR